MNSNRYSDLKIFGFPDKIRSFQEGRVTAPIYVRIKPVNSCNHGCRWCTYSDGTKRPRDHGAADHLQSGMHEAMNERDMMPTEKALDLVDDLVEIGTRAVTFTGGGEPLVHPHIVEIMGHAVNRHLDVSIITNGQRLDKLRAEILTFAKWVRVSIDYTTAAQMVASRNVPERFFQQVLENLRTFASLKKSYCDLGVNFIVTRENAGDLVPFASVLKDAGVENIRYSPVYVQGFREYHAPHAARVLAQLQEMQSLCGPKFSINSTFDLDSPGKAPSRPWSRCLYAQTVPVVGADLGVYACHNTAYTDHGRLGSIKNQRFKDFWFSAEARAAFDNLNPAAVCRHECANHSKVDLFNRLAEASVDNFV